MSPVSPVSRVSAIVAPLLALLAALLLLAMPPSAQAASLHVKTAIGVRVLNEAGKPVPAATVVLLTADGKKLALRYTNKEGRCFFPAKPGDYLVRAFRPDQGKGQESVTAVDGELTKVTVHLKKM